MIFTRGNQTMRFAHIPRTGGRGITAGLNKVGWKEEYPTPTTALGKRYCHLDLAGEMKCTKKTPEFSFTIVRHPVDRFLSAWRWEGQQITPSGDIFYDMNERVMTIAYPPDTLQVLVGLRDAQSNWYVPQVDFIDDDTHVWKFEDGIEEDFECWAHEKMGISISTDMEYYKARPSPLDGQLAPRWRIGECNEPPTIEQIEEYYAEDMKRFNYESKL